MYQKTYRFAFIIIIFFILCGAGQIFANPFIGDSETDGTGISNTATVRRGEPQKDLVDAQVTIKEKIANIMVSFNDEKSLALLVALLALSFGYGILHTLGPGHRKTIVFTFYVTRKAPWWEPASTGLVLSVLHSAATIVIMLVLSRVAGAISGKADSVSLWMEGLSWIFLVVMSIFLIVNAIRNAAVGTHSHGSEAHSAGLGTLLLTGIYPCPGAVLVLVLALSLNLLVLGIFVVLVMSLGMSLPLIASGYLAWLGRTRILTWIDNNERIFNRVSVAFELTGYLFLFIYSAYMVSPFALGLFRILFKGVSV